ncbi:hypothetical protein [Sphingomicrobium arenosum]|uniref:hypothetical protein n=1 Tax=Sphingomicrobium arenosum TaxID=2233861 RepID=UPI00223F5766|nr:hypothetical protein [Sphingomicrobium arenosum]
MAKRVKAPPGLDYDPVVGETEHLSFGVAQAGGERSLTATRFVGKRLFPVSPPDDWGAEWPHPTCLRADVLLPAGAGDDCWETRQLCEAYDRQGFGGLRDLVIITTVRFPDIDGVASSMRLHAAWEDARGFARSLVDNYGAPLVMVMHVPARAGRPGHPHVHLMMLARELLPSGFGKFVRALLSENGRDEIDKAWAAWRARSVEP